MCYASGKFLYTFDGTMNIIGAMFGYIRTDEKILQHSKV